MLTLVIAIEIGNDAIGDAEQIASHLREIADKCEFWTNMENGTGRDENGSTVSRWELTQVDKDDVFTAIHA
jgi:hypothetical protein